MDTGIGRLRNSYKVGKVASFVRRILWDPVRAAYLRVRLPAKLLNRHAKLHFGCGEIADGRFLNIDARAFPHVDYVTKSPMMPAIPEQSANMIYACHVFEHIPYGQQRRVLSRWHDLLRSGGELWISVPDFEKVTAQYMNGERDFESMQWVLMGGQDYPGNFHFALFTADRLRKLLEDAGFCNVRIWRPEDQENWPRDHSWDEALSLNLCANKF